MTNAADWAGRVGDVWAAEWRRTDRAFSGLAPHLDAAILAAAPPGPFTALDIGCGAGTTAMTLARARPDATVVGADLSDDLLAVARQRGAELPNLHFIHGDAGETAGQVRPDLLLSRHGVMFFPDPHVAFTALRKATSADARLVFSCFAAIEDNPWATLVTDAPSRSTSYVPGPFAFADQAVGRAFLIAAGWRDPSPRHIDFRYRAGAGTDPVSDAMDLFTRIGPAASLLRDTAPADRPSIEARLRDRLTAQRSGDTVDFPAAAWLWSAHA